MSSNISEYLYLVPWVAGRTNRRTDIVSIAINICRCGCQVGAFEWRKFSERYGRDPGLERRANGANRNHYRSFSMGRGRTVERKQSLISMVHEMSKKETSEQKKVVVFDPKELFGREYPFE